MTHLILTGCTGTAGSAILAHCIQSKSVSQVSVLSRRPVEQATGHEKVRVIIHKDFKSYPDSVLDQLKGATGCVWALGVPSGQVDSDREYQIITQEYPMTAAKAFSSLGPLFNFVYVSGEGANRNPGRLSQLFARVKGATELSLLSLTSTYPSLRIYNVRPAFIDDQGTHLKQGSKPFSYKMMDYAAPFFRILTPSFVSPAKHLAEVLVRCAEEERGKEEARGWLEGKGVRWEENVPFAVLIESVGLRQLAEI